MSKHMFVTNRCYVKHRQYDNAWQVVQKLPVPMDDDEWLAMQEAEIQPALRWTTTHICRNKKAAFDIANELKEAR